MRYAVAVIITLASVVSHSIAQHDMGAMPRSHTAGIIDIEVIQGTKGGPKIAGGEVTVFIVTQEGQSKTITTKLDENGKAQVRGISLAQPARAQVMIEHGGAHYQAFGKTLMDAAHPHQTIKVTVYETTDQPPQWNVPMWHVILQPSEKGIVVSEMIAAVNSSDHAYLGQSVQGQPRISVALNLPPGATDVKMSDALHGHSTRIVGGKVLNLEPLKPGLSRFRLTYTIPLPQGGTKITIRPPADVTRLMVMVPEDWKQFKSDALTPGDVLRVQERPMKSYTATNIPAGRGITFSISGLSYRLPPGAEARASRTPKLLAVSAGTVLLIGCIVALLYRNRDAAEPQSN